MPLMSNLNVNGNDYEIKDAAARGDISSLQTSKENVANKVTSISNTSTDTEYPSAKAVYTAVTNADRWEAVTYGTSTAAEIAAILTRGHIPYFIYSDRIYLYAATTPTAYFFQTMVITSSSPYLVGSTCLIATSAWSITQFTESTAISASSTNMQLAGAKAVYDFVTGIANTKQDKLYKHDIGFYRATGSTVELFDIKMFLTKSDNNPIVTPASLLNVMAIEYGPNVNIPASGSFINSSSETVQVLHMNANPYAYGGTGAFNAYGINTSTGLYEGREFINAPADIAVSDTVTGV